MVIIEYSMYLDLKTKFTGITVNKTYKVFRQNDIWHRYYGPVFITDNCKKSWHFNNKFYGWSNNGYNQKKFMS